MAAWVGLHADCKASANEAADLATLRRVLATPIDEVDLAKTKLAIDALVDPSIDADGSLAELARMTDDIRRIAGPRAGDRERLTTLRDYLYTAGQWNDARPFVYDLDDPLGRNVSTKLLTNY
ncbi:MAG TPA: hypothetical protein VMF52_01700, partial [Steroidobacteraceae bacterium]|nr:hypothetical protein [Steroidobacteraceae bacterium]